VIRYFSRRISTRANRDDLGAIALDRAQSAGEAGTLVQCRGVFDRQGYSVVGLVATVAAGRPYLTGYHRLAAPSAVIPNACGIYSRKSEGLRQLVFSKGFDAFKFADKHVRVADDVAGEFVQ